jgi:thiamine biosynthesis lipoprotein
LADAWATALNVLGPVEGPDIAEKEGLAALFVVRNRNGSFREVASTAFRELEQGEGAKP